MKTANRILGGRFEEELSHMLAANGFWVHVLQQNKAGQPADIIAVKGKYHTLIDCKVVSGKRFPFSRVEENQRLAMKRFRERGGEDCWFAMKLPDGIIRFAPFKLIQGLEASEYKGMELSFMQKYLNTPEEWLEMSNRKAKGESGENIHQQPNHD